MTQQIEQALAERRRFCFDFVCLVVGTVHL
jgi:hypothetical protein